MIEQVAEANAAGCRISSACKAAGIDARTFNRSRKNPEGDQRRGSSKCPTNKLSGTERSELLNIANSSEFMDKSPSQIVPVLADREKYVAPESSFYRVLKAAGMNMHRGKSKPATRKRPKELVATEPNQVYSWDITHLRTNVVGIFLYLYLVMDIYSRKIVGYSVHEEQCAEHASTMINRACKNEGIGRNQLTLHSDNGGPMKGATMLATLQRLGVMPSFSRPSVSDDYPYSEALFKTTKYCPMYPSKPFDGAADGLSWAAKFVEWYNDRHLHSGIKFVTPASRHRGEDGAILKRRKIVYETAKRLRPDRWSRATRNWEHFIEVSLNCFKEKSNSCNKIAA